MEKNVVKRLASHLGRRSKNSEIRYNLFLSGKLFKLLGTDYSVQFLIFALVDAVRIEFVSHTNNKIIIYKDT